MEGGGGPQGGTYGAVGARFAERGLYTVDVVSWTSSNNDFESIRTTSLSMIPSGESSGYEGESRAGPVPR